MDGCTLDSEAERQRVIKCVEAAIERRVPEVRQACLDQRSAADGPPPFSLQSCFGSKVVAQARLFRSVSSCASKRGDASSSSLHQSCNSDMYQFAHWKDVFFC
jgi:hypothetical protein